VTKKIDVKLQDNFFTIANKTTRLPMGEIGLVPGFEDKPLIIIGG
jgi:hypothetical protein